MNVPHTFCPLPWIHLAQRNNGHYRVCCHANQSKDKGILRDAGGRPLTASESDFSAVRNSPTLKHIRREMRANLWPEQCLRCKQEEDAGLKSRRLNELEKWAESFSPAHAARYTATDGGIDEQAFPLVSYDIRLGNVCNLKCRMCGPTDSRAWYTDYQKLHNVKHFNDTHGPVVFTDQNKNDPYLWFENDLFWEELFKQRDHIRSLYLVGGEPLLIEQHFTFLSRLVDEDAAKHIELVYNTNLTKLDPATLELWSHFREVNVGVSMDGVGAVNNYIRYPTDFVKLESHLRTLDQAKGPINMWIAPTIQMYNVLHILEFVQWTLDCDFHFLRKAPNSRILFFHPLHTPHHFNVRVLPPEVKQRVTHMYEEFFAQLNARYSGHAFERNVERTIRALRGILKFMHAKDESHRLPEFFEQTKRLDNLRAQKFSDVLPQLHIMLRDHEDTESSKGGSGPLATSIRY